MADKCSNNGSNNGNTNRAQQQQNNERRDSSNSSNNFGSIHSEMTTIISNNNTNANANGAAGVGVHNNANNDAVASANDELFLGDDLSGIFDGADDDDDDLSSESHGAMGFMEVQLLQQQQQQQFLINGMQQQQVLMNNQLQQHQQQDQSNSFSSRNSEQQQRPIIEDRRNSTASDAISWSSGSDASLRSSSLERLKQNNQQGLPPQPWHNAAADKHHRQSLILEMYVYTVLHASLHYLFAIQLNYSLLGPWTWFPSSNLFACLPIPVFYFSLAHAYFKPGRKQCRRVSGYISSLTKPENWKDDFTRQLLRWKATSIERL